MCKLWWNENKTMELAALSNEGQGGRFSPPLPRAYHSLFIIFSIYFECA